MKLIDLTGKKFGLWTVICRDYEYQKLHGYEKPYWKCKCDCGTIKSVSGKDLRDGKSTNCGCVRKQTLSKYNESINPINAIIGNRYGKLTVIKYLYTYHKAKHNDRIYLCQCDCGNQCEVRAISLRNGNTISCGCIKSKGEYIINKILSNNNMIFTTQKTYPDLLSPENRLLKFDYFINNEFLLEYDGEQHFTTTRGWGASKEE